MGNLKTILLTALSAVLIYGAFWYLRVRFFLKTYKYGYEVRSVNAQALLSPAAFVNGRAFIDVNFNVWVDNPTGFSVTLNELEIRVYWQGQYMGKSTDFETIKTVRNGRTTIPAKARVQISPALMRMLINANADTVRLEYVVTCKPYILPITFTYNDTYDFKISDYI